VHYRFKEKKIKAERSKEEMGDRGDRLHVVTDRPTKTEENVSTRGGGRGEKASEKILDA